MPRACVAVRACRRTRTLQGSGSMLPACVAAPACQPVRALQAGEESIAKLLTTIRTQPGGKRRGFMARYGLGLVLLVGLRRQAQVGLGRGIALWIFLLNDRFV